MPTDIDRMRDRLLHEILPYRIKSVDTLHRAILWQAEWPNPTPMEVYADGNRMQRLAKVVHYVPAASLAFPDATGGPLPPPAADRARAEIRCPQQRFHEAPAGGRLEFWLPNLAASSRGGTRAGPFR